LGRVFGVRLALVQGAYALSILGAAAAVVHSDVSTLFVVFGAVAAVPALVGVYVPSVRHA
jgi:hypothetical protein